MTDAPRKQHSAILEVRSPLAMEALGRTVGVQLLRAAPLLAAGLVVGLEGDLGAGKTTFVRGLVEGVTGAAQRVTSPTFQLMNLYRPLAAEGTRAEPAGSAGHGGGNSPAGRTLAHIDAYRLTGAQAFAELGLVDLLEENVIVVVEWPDKTGHPVFETEALYLRFTHVAETVRGVEIVREPAGIGLIF